MLSTEKVVLTDGIENEAGTFAAEYEGVTFVFETAEQRTLWIDNTNHEDIVYIIEAAAEQE